MKAADYKKLKKQVEERYQQALEKAERDRVEALAAIEKVWKMLNPRRGRAAVLTVSSSTKSSSSSYGSFVETVRKSLEYVPKRFTRKNVLTAMQEISSDIAKNCNPNSLSGCLYRLKKEGIIIEVKKGQGSAPAEYELVTTSINEESKEQQNVE